jgi:hypothetical protein
MEKQVLAVANSIRGGIEFVILNVFHTDLFPSAGGKATSL